MMVLPSRSPSATLIPCVIRCSSTRSTVSALNSHLLTRRRIDGARNGAVVVPFQRVPGFLLLVGELVVADAAVEEVGGERHRLGRHQEAVLHGLVEAIGVGRHAGLQVEQPVGVAIDLALRRGGQADQQAVEIFEDRLVLAIDRAMRLVDHDEVEMPDAEATLPASASSIRPIMVG